MKRWNLKPSPDPSEIIRLSKALGGVHPVFAKLLLQRGITTYDAARSFFRPKLTDMHNPFLMTGMEEAVERINIAIERHERLLIYGDYDVDGTTSVALVYSYLKQFVGAENMDYYIPDRYAEGYGISFKGIDYAVEHGITLVIALDCGIKAVEKIDYACQRGIDFIICDHHTPGDSLPRAVACLNPKREDCTYPDKNLSGCGVGFKLMQAFCRKNLYNEDDLLKYLDLLAVSIASDIVPIIGENRVLAYHGLKKLNEDPCIGLKSIIDEAKLSGKQISVSDIVFKIGPRINAAGRMGQGANAVKLLISEDPIEADEICLEIEQNNDDRKETDRGITDEALEMIKQMPNWESKKSTVLFSPSWHKGVVGIVASRLTETYYRPTVILMESNGFASGSARSVDGFDLYKAIDSCSDLLENFGGHMYAAGLTMKKENVPAFMDRFEQYVSENILPEQLIPQVEIDAELHLSDITPSFFNILSQFEPFGPCNPQPIFVTQNVFDYGGSRLVGKDKDDKTVALSRKHIKLEVTELYSPAVMQGVAFGMGEAIEAVKSGAPLSLCYTIEENVFRNVKSLQLMVKDIHYNLKDPQ